MLMRKLIISFIHNPTTQHNTTHALSFPPLFLADLPPPPPPYLRFFLFFFLFCFLERKQERGRWGERIALSVISGGVVD
ncbi:hypothetical protein MLD38_000499 [Melastoma candidum]|uniref:Uncharacterized protein n=1 Tax=Melastoma candidum TaxID=119954 RepID=A0ACB9S9L6_9MYRT|nr:hypothetical protein MLD38_000499 [Melastoma candidum]